MAEVVELLAGPNQVREILQHPLGTIGVIKVDGETTTAFLRAHDRGEEPRAYLADEDTYGDVADFLSDQTATYDQEWEEGDVVAWRLTDEGLVPFHTYDTSLRGQDDEEGESEYGNNEQLEEKLRAAGPGSAFLFGDVTSEYSSFALLVLTKDELLCSGCAPTLSPDYFDPAEFDDEELADPPQKVIACGPALVVHGSLAMNHMVIQRPDSEFLSDELRDNFGVPHLPQRSGRKEDVGLPRHRRCTPRSESSDLTQDPRA